MHMPGGWIYCTRGVDADGAAVNPFAARGASFGSGDNRPIHGTRQGVELMLWAWSTNLNLRAAQAPVGLESPAYV